MRYFCDVNVLLDSVLQRSQWQADADAILAAGRAGRITVCVSSLTLANLHYTARKVIGNLLARQSVEELVRFCEVLPVDRSTFLRAQALAGPDFEDDLQLACAVQAAVDAIVTRDPRGYAHSPVPVLSPADLVAQLAGPTTP
jgi:predicted nucleic acid-binding protein